MKKVFIICLLFLLFSFFADGLNSEDVYIEKRGIFISYIELSKYIKDKSISDSKKNIEQMILNIKNLNFNLVILQIRSFSDSIYPSKIFPWSSMVSSSEGVDPGYDILKYFIDRCHENNIFIYGWINPYRVRSYSDDSISTYNPAYKWLNTRHIIVNDGIYYNPSSDLVIDLIADGVSEVIVNYELDGILFDDYFYPCSDCDYADYLNSNSSLSYDEYKLDRVNKMVKRVYSVCKSHDILFGISPDANIENNYNKLFSDVKRWVSSDGYIDFIMPQVYYGFFNEAKPFKKVIDEWDSLITNENIDLMIGLGFYKNGSFDQWARSGSFEWINNSNIIMREIILSRNLNNYNGFSLFRYDYLFSNDKYTENTLLEIENMKKVLK